MWYFTALTVVDDSSKDKEVQKTLRTLLERKVKIRLTIEFWLKIPVLFLKFTSANSILQNLKKHADKKFIRKKWRTNLKKPIDLWSKCYSRIQWSNFSKESKISINDVADNSMETKSICMFVLQYQIIRILIILYQLSSLNFDYNYYRHLQKKMESNKSVSKVAKTSQVQYDYNMRETVRVIRKQLIIIMIQDDDEWRQYW